MFSVNAGNGSEVKKEQCPPRCDTTDPDSSSYTSRVAYSSGTTYPSSSSELVIREHFTVVRLGTTVGSDVSDIGVRLRYINACVQTVLN